MQSNLYNNKNRQSKEEISKKALEQENRGINGS